MPQDVGKHPNLYILRGKDLQVAYSTEGIDGRPHLEYQDGDLTLQFTGDDIRMVPTEIGTLVTVSTQRAQDTGHTTFSLLLPQVYLGESNQTPLNAEGIRAVHRHSVAPRLNVGQRDTYQIVRLAGTASYVLF